MVLTWLRLVRHAAPSYFEGRVRFTFHVHQLYRVFCLQYVLFRAYGGSDIWELRTSAHSCVSRSKQVFSILPDESIYLDYSGSPSQPGEPVSSQPGLPSRLSRRDKFYLTKKELTFRQRWTIPFRNLGCPMLPRLLDSRAFSPGQSAGIIP